MPGGGGGKGGKGGGGGGAIDVTSTSTSTIDSESNSSINSNSNNQIDARTSAELRIAGLDNIHVNQNSDSKNEVRLAITEPIRTESISKTELDVKPLQAEFCLKVGVERLPSTRICKPTERRFGITLFGTEVIGFSYAEEKTTLIEDLSRQPFVIGGHNSCGPTGGRAKVEPNAGGLRIRLEDI